MKVSNYASSIEEETFVKYHQRLRGELNNANWHFAIWKYLQELRSTHLRELNQAPAFFGLTINAHLLDTLIRINKFFDRREQHLNIRKFLDFIEENLGIFLNKAFKARMCKQGRYDSYIMKHHTEITPQKVEQDRNKINALPTSHIRAWRNKVLAHIETKSVLQNIDIMKKYPVKPRQIDDIINTLHEILNEYSSAYDSSTWVKDLPVERGIQRVMDSIRFTTERNSGNGGQEGNEISELSSHNLT